MTGAGRIVAACLLAALAAGCGSSHKPAAPADPAVQVNAVIHSYLNAQAQGDGATACGLLTPAAQKQLIDLVVADGKGLITSRPSCSDAVGLVHTFAGTQLLSAVENARIEQVQVSGDTATARVADGSTFKPQQVRLEKPGGTWKVTGVPSLTAGSS
jgi:hypothetical protein